MNTKDYFILAAFLIGLILVLKLTMIQTPKPTTIAEVKSYKDSIAKLDLKITSQMRKISNYEKIIDSLNSLPAKIKIKYRDQKAFVPSATILQLDSIIRTNAGLQQR